MRITEKWVRKNPTKKVIAMQYVTHGCAVVVYDVKNTINGDFVQVAALQGMERTPLTWRKVRESKNGTLYFFFLGDSYFLNDMVRMDSPWCK